LLKKDGRAAGEEAERQAGREREEKGGKKLRSRESVGERVGQVEGKESTGTRERGWVVRGEREGERAGE